MKGTRHKRRPGRVRPCCKQILCIITELLCRWRGKPLVCLWVQKLVVYDTMRCTVQQLRVLQNLFDLFFQRLRGIGFSDNKMTTIQTYHPENHESLQTRGEEHEDRWWGVTYDPSKDSREPSQRDGREAHVYSCDNVPLKIGKR